LNSSASSVDSHRCRSPLRGAPRQPYGRLGLLLFHRDVKPQLVGLERRLTSLPIPAARGPSSAVRPPRPPALPSRRETSTRRPRASTHIAADPRCAGPLVSRTAASASCSSIAT